MNQSMTEIGSWMSWLQFNMRGSQLVGTGGGGGGGVASCMGAGGRTGTLSSSRVSSSMMVLTWIGSVVVRPWWVVAKSVRRPVGAPGPVGA